jgi:hypothetical protein
MRWIGFTRPPWPICGPSAPSGSARLKTTPRFTVAGRAPHDVRRDVVQRPALVVGAPAAPVGDATRDRLEPLHRCGSSASAVAVAVTSSRWLTHWTSQRTSAFPSRSNLSVTWPLHPGDVAHVVELVVARLEAREEAVVADPVGDALAEPRAPLRAEVVRAGQPEERCVNALSQ